MLVVWLKKTEYCFEAALIDTPLKTLVIEDILYRLAELPRFLGGGFFQYLEYKYIDNDAHLYPKAIEFPIDEATARKIYATWNMNETFEENFLS